MKISSFFKTRTGAAAIMLFLLSLFPLHAEGNTTWNLGTLDIVWNHLSPNEDGTDSMDKASLSLLDFQFYSRESRLGVQFSLLHTRTCYETSSTTAFMPVELFYNFTKSPNFMLGLYAMGEVGFSDSDWDMHPYFEGGVKIGTFINDKPALKYSWKNSFYAGIDSRGEINIGTQFDYGSLILLALLARAEESR